MTCTTCMVSLGLLLGLALPAGGSRPAAAQTPPFQDGAQAYERWLDTCLDGLDQQIPAITQSAERAARLYVEKDYAIATRGDPGVRGEALGRSGGIMEMNVSRPSPIILEFPTDTKDLAASPRWRDDRPVVTFAPRWMVDQVRTSDWPDQNVIITHAAGGGGLFTRPDGRQLVAIDGVAGVAALWVWTGEFVAACTRLGRMPCMYQGFAVPGGRERAERLTKVNPKFHPEPPQRVPAGKLGKAYLEALRRDLTAVYGERRRIRQLAELTVATLKAGRRSYIFPPTHVLFAGHVGGPFDPGYFTRINNRWSLDSEMPLTPGDLVFYNGFDEVCSGSDRERLRAAGVRLAWSFAGYKTDPNLGVQAVGKDELFIDQHWKHGDAVVEVPGYDIPILPTSGVLTETILRMVESEIVRIATGKLASEIRPAPTRSTGAPDLKPATREIRGN